MGETAGTAAGGAPARLGHASIWTEELAARLGRSVVRMRREMRHHHPSELTVSQLSLLGTIVRLAPLPVGQLAEVECVPPPSITRLVDRLEVDGLVLRRANPVDRRGVLVVATAAGARLHAAYERAGNAWIAQRLEGLSPAERVEAEHEVELLERLAGAGSSGAER